MNPSTIAALSVPCPSCRARPGERCRTAKRSGVHTPRVQRGLQKTRNDEYRQHERAARAQGRVPQAIAAGCTPVDSDITTALACTCSDCQLGELVLLVGPVLMGAAR